MRAEFIVPADHPAFDGHFPGHPLWPGALLLDEVASRLPGVQGPVRFAQVKFRREVPPGTRLRFDFDLQADGSVRFAVESDDGLVADGRVSPA